MHTEGSRAAASLPFRARRQPYTPALRVVERENRDVSRVVLCPHPPPPPSLTLCVLVQLYTQRQADKWLLSNWLYIYETFARHVLMETGLYHPEDATKLLSEGFKLLGI